MLKLFAWDRGLGEALRFRVSLVAKPPAKGISPIPQNTVDTLSRFGGLMGWSILLV